MDDNRIKVSVVSEVRLSREQYNELWERVYNLSSSDYKGKILDVQINDSVLVFEDLPFEVSLHKLLGFIIGSTVVYLPNKLDTAVITALSSVLDEYSYIRVEYYDSVE